MPFITQELTASLEQGLAKNIYIQLIDFFSGLPILGAVSFDVTISLLKSDGTSFIDIILIDPPYDDYNFIEISDGFYKVTLSASDLNILGAYVIHVKPKDPNPSSPDPTPQFPNMLEQYLMSDVVHQQLVTVAGPPTCVVFGNVKDLTGVPAEHPYSVKAQVIKFPALFNDNYITAEPITVYTDINGFFQIRLTQGALIILEIVSAGYRRQLTVPAFASCDISALPGA